MFRNGKFRADIMFVAEVTSDNNKWCEAGKDVKRRDSPLGFRVGAAPAPPRVAARLGRAVRRTRRRLVLL